MLDDLHALTGGNGGQRRHGHPRLCAPVRGGVQDSQRRVGQIGIHRCQFCLAQQLAVEPLRLAVGQPFLETALPAFGIGKIGYPGLHQPDVFVCFARKFLPEALRLVHDRHLGGVAALLANPAPVTA